MKKFYAFVAAALLSVCAFASKEVVPSDAVIKEACEYEAGQVCVCIYVPSDMACNDIIFVGTYNNWGKGTGTKEDAANCVKFQPIDNYDGWYVVSVEDETASPEGKPLMLDGDGKFNWSYQIGDAAIERGAVTIVAGLPGEIDLKTYGKDAPNVYYVNAWKSNPCTAIYHNYKITVINDGCEGYVWPYVVGAMTNWAFEKMTVDVAKTKDLGVGVYYYSFKAAEGTEYQLASGVMDGDGNITEEPKWADIAYLQQLVGEKWVRMPGEKGDNLLTKEAAEILFDIRVDTLRWARCDGQVAENVVVKLKAPAGAPEAIEIIGSYDAWTGAPMTLNNGVWEATVSAKPDNVFKFRTGVGEDADTKWKNQIAYYDDDEDEWMTFGDNGGKSLVFQELWTGEEGARVINLDFSGENYKWTLEEPTAIENVVLTEKAKKVVVDGVVYIIRNNKMFNLQGAQVR